MFLKVAQRQNTQGTNLPAPVGGINAVDPLSEMTPRDSVYCFNFVSKDYGLVVRNGYRQLAHDLNEVRSIIPFTASVPANNKLFAVDNTGIYDVTAGGAVGAPVVSWGTTTGDAGKCSYVQFTNAAGNHLLVCDEENGYVYYTEGVGWTTAPAVTGVAAADLVYVCIWKDRLWFVEKNTGKVWYLAVLAIAGAATVFYVGSKFRYGGEVRAIFNWSQDAGAGIDDYLCFLSSSGDVLIYQGTDPNDSSKFAEVGNWFIGPPPAGRRVGSSFGGDVLLLSAYGLTELSKLSLGEMVASSTSSIARKINPLLQQAYADKSSLFGWDIQISPKHGAMLISVPLGSDAEYLQIVFSYITGAWTVWSGLPIVSMDVWQGELYFGDVDGNIHYLSGNTDGVAEDGSGGDPIPWMLLGAYLDYEAPARNKRMQFIRPIFIGEQNPSYAIQARYDYDLDALSLPFTSFTSPSEALVWDTSLWDVGVWGGVSGLKLPLYGGSGMGRACAIGLQGESRGKLTLLGFNTLLDVGGYL